MENVNYGPRRLLDVAFFTAAAFVVGGIVQRLLATELAPPGAATHALSPWILAAVLLQGAVGFLGLAWILRDRFPLLLLWIAGMLGLAAAHLLVALALPWSGDISSVEALFTDGNPRTLVLLVLAPGAVGLVTGLVMSAIMQTNAAGIVKLGLVCTVGFFAAELARLAAVVGLVLVAVNASWMLPDSLSVGTIWTIGAVVRDAMVGVAAALGVGWALGRSTLPDGSTVHYVVTATGPAHRRTPAGLR